MKQFFLLFSFAFLGIINNANAQGFEAKHSFFSGGLAIIPNAGGYAQYEYSVSDHIGIGASYSTVGSSAVAYARTVFSVGVSTYGVRAAYHFNSQAKFDPYLTVGIGLERSTLDYTGYSVAITTFGAMGGVGARYYFTNRLAGNLEVVYKEPLMKLGLTFKL